MQKVVEFWRNLRVRTKFLLILLLAIALVGTVSIAAIRIPLQAYDEQLYRSSSQTITLFAEQIQSELKSFEAISYRILTDNALQDNLSVMKNSLPGTVKWVNANAEVTKRVAYFSLWFSNTVRFQLKTVKGNSYSQFFGASVNSDKLTPEYMERAQGHGGRLVWLTEDGEEPQLFLLREIREIEGFTFDTLAVMLIEVNLPAIVEQYCRGMTQMDSPLLCGIFDGGVCLYASNDAIRTLGTGEDGYTRMKLDGRNVLCVSRRPSGLRKTR